MNGGYSFESILKILAFTVTVIVFLMLSKQSINTDKKLTTKYDERQKLVRGTAYKYSFWTLSFMLMLYANLEIRDIQLPVSRFVIYFFMICASILVHAVYCILNDGYMGLNNNPKRIYLMCVVLCVLNLVAGIIGMMKKEKLMEDKLGTPLINIIAGSVLLIVGVFILIKATLLRNEDDDEDDDDEGEDD